MGFTANYFNRDIRPQLDAEDVCRINGVAHYRGRAVHDAMLAKALDKRPQAGAAAGDDPDLFTGDSPALERLRTANASIKELELARLREQLLPRQDVHTLLGHVASAYRRAGEQLQRRYGRDALDVVDEALADAERIARESLGGEQPHPG